MDSQDILDRAYSILSDHGWCRGSYAKDDAGNDVPVASQDARSFCAVGLVSRAAHELGINPVMDDSIAYRTAIARLNKTIQPFPGEITHWNDVWATEEDVRGLFRSMATPTMEPTISLA